MATTVTLRLSNNAHTFNAEKSTGFAIRGGVKYYDRDSKKDEWTNYEAVVFASSPAQIDYYTQNLVEGAVVEVSASFAALHPACPLWPKTRYHVFRVHSRANPVLYPGVLPADHAVFHFDPVGCVGGRGWLNQG